MNLRIDLGKETLQKYSYPLEKGGSVTIYDLFNSLQVASGCQFLEKKLLSENQRFNSFGKCTDLFGNTNMLKGLNIVSSTMLDDA